MKKLLVTGASGFLVWNICTAAKNNWTIVGTVFSNPIHIDGINILRTDLTGFREVKKIFKDVKPDAVIHTAAAASPDYCQIHKSSSHKMNVDTAVNIGGLCADSRIPLVFTSTDLVFDGLHAPYTEDDPVSPVNTYGEQKVLAEEGVLKRYPVTAVCRMSLMFGDPGPAASSFFVSMLRALKEDREIKLFTDEFRTPLSGAAAVQGIFLALEKVHGLIHLGGAERISRYDFGLLLMDVLGITKSNIVPSLQQDVTMPAPRVPDVSLDNSRAVVLGFRPLSLRKELEKIVNQGNL
jgi:dTDP-4-dehydrorhamnose reductase